MAKITITLEDQRDERGRASVAIDLTGVPTNLTGAPKHTEAVRIFNKVFDLVAQEKLLGTVPACRWQTSTKTVH